MPANALNEANSPNIENSEISLNSMDPHTSRYATQRIPYNWPISSRRIRSFEGDSRGKPGSGKRSEVKGLPHLLNFHSNFPPPSSRKLHHRIHSILHSGSVECHRFQIIAHLRKPFLIFPVSAYLSALGWPPSLTFSKSLLHCDLHVTAHRPVEAVSARTLTASIPTTSTLIPYVRREVAKSSGRDAKLADRTGCVPAVMPILPVLRTNC